MKAKDKDSQKIKDLKLEIDKAKDDIDFLYNLIQPDMPDLPSDDFSEYGETVEISDELYQEMYKYAENKNWIFMGVA
tara:strand:+ start:796 stop:1026 length:231 start_codon:yes stop_codon:yes gene_type:complete